jgi:thiol-disulfide isomerase/thioredoxin
MPLVEAVFSREEFLQKLRDNRGVILFKFGAEWCGPCKKIKDYLVEWGDKLGDSIEFYEIDADESFDLFAYMKTKKIVPAIPAVLQYRAGTVDYIPDRVVIGADCTQIDNLFENAVLDAIQLRRGRAK